MGGYDHLDVEDLEGALDLVPELATFRVRAVSGSKLATPPA
jgi:hypothetical protein